MKVYLTQKRDGFTLVEIMIVVAIIGLLAAIATPNLVNARQKSQRSACIHNLRQIHSAIQQHALEHPQAGLLVDGDMIAPYLPRGVNNSAADIENRVFCPLDGNRAFSSSYAGGLSSVNVDPLCMIGSGLSPAHSLP